ncbi:hypothetical protein RRG08_005172 [Elysia crispata]|uniref:Uncharacterized protein n=1 Tax=Elysia crispata TaxID=231223 RepID=A0AAE0ZHD2_9GAST|nr:hypothetical protein RRG08_005172 [Elysia crispata]
MLPLNLFHKIPCRIQAATEDMINKVTTIIHSNYNAPSLTNTIGDKYSVAPTDHGWQATAERRKRPVNKWKQKKELYKLRKGYKNAKGKTVAARSLGVGCNPDTCKRR